MIELVLTEWFATAIKRGHLVFGTASNAYPSCTWQHFSCLHPENLQAAVDKLGSPKSLSGYLTLSPADRARIRDAFQHREDSQDDNDEGNALLHNLLMTILTLRLVS